MQTLSGETEMGLTKVTATVTEFTKSKQGYEATFLVDTGAIDCMATGERISKSVHSSRRQGCL